jgi:DNA-directed RNA polymerase subunit omega
VSGFFFFLQTETRIDSQKGLGRGTGLGPWKAHRVCTGSIIVFSREKPKMARVTIEDCLQRVENRFALVHLAVRRVLQLRRGATPLVDAPKNKEIVLALREIAAGLVSVDNIRELEVVEPRPQLIPPGMSDADQKELQEMLEAATRLGAEPAEGLDISEAGAEEGEES